MAPKGKKSNAPPPASKPATSSSTTTTPAASLPPQPPETIGLKLLFEFITSSPALAQYETGGYSSLTASQKERLPFETIRSTGSWRTLSKPEQAKFLKSCDTLRVKFRRERPEPLGRDHRGRRIDDYSVAEYEVYKKELDELSLLSSKSKAFREDYREWKRLGRQRKGLSESDLKLMGEGKLELYKKLFAGFHEARAITDETVEAEKERRKRMAALKHEKLGRYVGDPVWDDVVPLPQDDGVEKPLAKIAYDDEYAEAISYLRATMARNDHSPRILALTAHIILLNPAHYTVWLYRAATLFALKSSIHAELQWVNDVALNNQKNYQIWHHRQLLITTLLAEPEYAERSAILDLASSELEFMDLMFEQDSKNYHVWSYRQWLVRRLEIFPSQVPTPTTTGSPDELAAIKNLLDQDVRNNSAWSHRFFVVFSDPGHSTPESRATEMDPAVPSAIIDREVAFSQEQIRLAPQNQSGWNYLRGVLRKGGRSIGEVEAFAKEFAGEGEGGVAEGKVLSSHALEVLADCFAERGEKEEAVRLLGLLAGKYDVVRKNFWEWKIENLT